MEHDATGQPIDIRAILDDVAKARIGRPPLGKSTTLINLKAPIADIKRWRAVARSAGISLSEWLREAAEEKRERETRRKR